MALEMRMECEKCGAALAMDGEARICSYECTFCVNCAEDMATTCPNCAEDMATTCPNCGGELVARPRRAKG